MRPLTSTLCTLSTLLMFFLVSQSRTAATFAPRSPPSGRGCLRGCSSPSPLSPLLPNDLTISAHLRLLQPASPLLIRLLYGSASLACLGGEVFRNRRLP